MPTIVAAHDGFDAVLLHEVPHGLQQLSTAVRLLEQLGQSITGGLRTNAHTESQDLSRVTAHLYLDATPPARQLDLAVGNLRQEAKLERDAVLA